VTVCRYASPAAAADGGGADGVVLVVLLLLLTPLKQKPKAGAEGVRLPAGWKCRIVAAISMY
jgi:hypothetical protein